MDKKYQCLVEATENSSIELPAIKAGTTVDSVSTDMRPPEMGVSAEFQFEGNDGKMHQLRANDVMASDEGRYGIFGLGSGGKTITRSTADVAAKVDTDTGAETVYGANTAQKVKAGSVEQTVNKIFRCLDPLIGS